MWTATMTRTEIACAERAMTKFFEDPGLAHKIAARKGRAVLLNTKEWEMTYSWQGCGLKTDAYTNSDFGACLDNRPSVSGAVVMLAIGAISVHARIQAVTASGTSKADYIAFSEVLKEALALRQVQGVMEPSMTIGVVDVFGDNEGAIKLTMNKHTRCRTKHIDVIHDLIRDACDAEK